MNRTERRLLTRTLSLGLALTLLVIAANGAGMLDPFERYLYDLRARHFQYFTPPPTDKIVHLDVDDPTLKDIGWWPWPRTKLAEIVDEIHLAGAKVIGFDVVFPEPQETRYEKQLDGSFKAIEDDQNFAAAISRAGNILIPVSVQLGKQESPTAQASSTVVERLLSFAQPMPPGLPPMLKADSELATILPFAQATRYSGVVEFLTDPDGVVRSVPLFVDYRGKLMPHMALAAFCASIDVDMADVKVTPDSVTIPRRNAPPIVVPVRTVDSRVHGPVGMFMDVPWFGKAGNNWQRIFDVPNHAVAKQHEPLANIWSIPQRIRSIQKNKQLADQALSDVNSAFPSSKTTAFLASPTDEMRDETVKATLKDMTDAGVSELEKLKQAELKEDEAKFLGAYRALRTFADANQKLVAEITKARADLREKLKGRYALIGWTATGKTDFYPSSIDPFEPGVAMQGVVFNALATGDFWKSAPWWVGPLFTFILGAATTVIVATLPSAGAVLSSTVMVVAYLLLNAFVFFDYGNIIVPAAAPITVAMLICFGVTVARFIYERRERSRITQRFSSYVDPMLVNVVIEDPDSVRFDGQVKEMTVVFTDLAGFTTISEKLRERTVPLLNEYMSLMLPIIRENNGYWNKFLGDGIMFFYNAPADNAHHARDAVHTVLEMQKAMGPFNKRLLESGLPQVTMRAGMTTGMMVVGDAGSTDPKYHAADYTVLGDEVNLGARLESANKAIGSRVLISGRTAEMVGSEFLLRPIGALQVVGKTHGVMTFEALCAFNEANDKQKKLVEMSSAIVGHFKGAQFDPCIQTAREMEDQFGSTKFTQLYMRLSKSYLIEPPDDDFDGQIVLDEK